MNQAALAVINDETQVEAALRTTAQELCDSAGDFIIMTRADLSAATDLVKTIKTRFRDVEDERKRLVKPFNDGVDAINARFKSMTVPLKDAEETLKTKMLAFQKEEERRAKEEQERIEKARREAEEKARKEAEESGNGDDIRSMSRPEPVEAPPAPVHKPTTYGQTGAVSTVKKQWTFELVDIRALANARPDLVVVDTVKINQEIRGRGGDIAGLRIYEKDVLQVR